MSRLLRKKYVQLIFFVFGISTIIISFQNFSVPLSDNNTIDIQYGYNLDGDVISIYDNVDSTFNQTFEYDGVSRLVKAEFPNATGQLMTGAPANLGGTIAYNNTGDITQYTEFGRTQRTLKYNATTQRLESSTGPEALSFTYDDQGNITGNSKNKYVYRSPGNMVQVQSATGATIADYTYDAGDIRVKKSVGGKNTYYVYVGNNLLFEASDAVGSSYTKEYYYLGNNLMSTSKAANVGGVAKSEYEYYHFNPVKSTIGISKQSGGLVRERYNAYGSHLATKSKGEVNAEFNSSASVRFAGHVSDDESGLIYMGARHYNPSLGRFNEIDPKDIDVANIQSFNRYAYANNNPNKFVDPDGKVAFLAAIPALVTAAKAADVALTGAELYSAFQTGGVSAVATSVAAELTGSAFAKKFVPGAKVAEKLISPELSKRLGDFYKRQQNGCVASACALAGDYARAFKAHKMNVENGFRGVDTRKVFPDAQFKLTDYTEDIFFKLDPGDFVHFRTRIGGGINHLEYFSGTDKGLSALDLSVDKSFYQKVDIFKIPSK